MFQDDATAALADASTRLAPDLPAEFSEALSTSWRGMTDWHSSVAYQASRSEALAVYGDDIYQRTGERLPTTALGEDLISPDDFNAEIQKVNEKYPVNLPTLSADDIDRMALQRMAKAKSDSEAMAGREKTWGGTLGNLLGTFGGGLADPVAAVTLPLGGAGELGILARGLEFAAISGGTEATIAGLTAVERERAVPGSSKEIPGEIATATGAGFLLGGAFGTLGKFLKAGERPLPTSVRDEVNVGASEAQLNATNVFPTAEGEIAGRDATVQAVTQAAKGEPVTAGRDFDTAHVQAFADSVGAHDPEALAQAGDRALRPITFGELPEVEHLATMPIAGEDTAGYWDRYLERATPEERAAVGATDVPVQPEARPAETLTSEAPKPASDVSGRITPTDLSPKDTAVLAAEPSTYDAVQRNLDRIRLENPDAEFSTQVRQPDGSYQLVTRRLEDVLDEIDGMHETGKELLACATGMMAAE